jgi:hypothetical protein
VEALEARSAAIRMARERPLDYAMEPMIWHEIDLRMARKRLEHPGVVLELLVLGGIRSGKTFGSLRRLLSNFLYTVRAWVWSYADTQSMSQTIQQAQVHGLLPPEMRSETGKHKSGLKTKFSYKEGSGFTGDYFNIHWSCADDRGTKLDGGGLFYFRFYHSANSAAQGAELTAAACDELVELETVDTVRERLLTRAKETRAPGFLERIRTAVKMLEGGQPLPASLLGAIYHGVEILTFTPKEGYSAVVADFLDGAVTMKEVPARCPRWALPQTEDFQAAQLVRSDVTGEMVQVGMAEAELEALTRDMLPGRMVPRFKQPKKATRLVGYIFTFDNVHGGNWPGQVENCRDKPAEYVRTIAFGDVDKTWSVQFTPPFRDLHHVIHDRAMIPRVGTWRVIADPHRARPWFLCFHFTDALQRRYVMREWPQEGATIPRHGDPGSWAVTSRSGKINGDQGDAQKLRLGWGFDHYTREILRVAMEIGGWFYTEGERAAWWVTVTWEEYPEWKLEGAPVPIEDALMDPRFGNTKTGTAAGEESYIEGMETAARKYKVSGTGAGLFRRFAFEPGPGADLHTGDGLIVNALGGYDAGSFEPERPNAMNCPDLRFWHECRAHIYTMQNFSLAAFTADTSRKDEACKEPRDCLSMVEQFGPRHVVRREHTEGEGW